MIPATTSRTAGRVGARVELARYQLPTSGERVLYGQRVRGAVRFLPGDRVVVVMATGD